MRKRRLSLRGRRGRRVRGIILSTEMILLLTAVIMFAVIAFFGISKAVLSQATSSKQTLVLVRAEAWKVGSGIAVSLYVHNTGSQPVRVLGAGIKYTYNNQLYQCETSFTTWLNQNGITVNPGESKVISYAVGPNSGTGDCDNVRYVNAGADIYVYAKVYVSGSFWNTITQQVGTGVKVTSP